MLKDEHLRGSVPYDTGQHVLREANHQLQCLFKCLVLFHSGSRGW